MCHAAQSRLKTVTDWSSAIATLKLARGSIKEYKPSARVRYATDTKPASWKSRSPFVLVRFDDAPEKDSKLLDWVFFLISPHDGMTKIVGTGQN